MPGAAIRTTGAISPADGLVMRTTRSLKRAAPRDQQEIFSYVQAFAQASPRNTLPCAAASCGIWLPTNPLMSLSVNQGGTGCCRVQQRRSAKELRIRWRTRQCKERLPSSFCSGSQSRIGERRNSHSHACAIAHDFFSELGWAGHDLLNARRMFQFFKASGRVRVTVCARLS